LTLHPYSLTQESAYNPYYAHLAQQLCEFTGARASSKGHEKFKFKFTFQLAFWDLFGQFDDADMNSRRVTNQARMLAHLLYERVLSLAVLKVRGLG